MPGLDDAPAGEYLTDGSQPQPRSSSTRMPTSRFFLYIPHYGVHTPMRAKEELVKKYPEGPKPGVQSNPIYAA